MQISENWKSRIGSRIQLQKFKLNHYSTLRTVSDLKKECYMDGPSPVSPSETPDQSSATPLDSWKEIATYVKRDVSTVQRWEKREGMPVHRHVHDKRGSVYAYTSELDTWLQSRRLRLEQEEKEHTAEISEDAERDGLEQIQKLTDTYIGKIDELSKSKEHEIMSV